MHAGLAEHALAVMVRRIYTAVAQETQRQQAAGALRANTDDMLRWGRHYFPDVFPLPWSRLHGWFAKDVLPLLGRGQARIVVEAPRGASKTTVLTFLHTMYRALHATSREYIILCSETSEQACAYLDPIKEHLTVNEDLAAAYPHICGIGPVWRKNKIVLRNGVCIEALGAGKSIRGRLHAGRKPSLIVVDDPEGEDAPYSKTLRDHIRSWFLRGVSKAVRPEASIIVAGTRLHQECLTGWLSSHGGWVRPSAEVTGNQRRAFASIRRWPDRMDLWEHWATLLTDLVASDPEADALAFYVAHKAEMDAGAVVLWPEREPLYDLMRIRVMEGVAAFEAEKQNNPRDLGSTEWGPECFEGDIWFSDWPKDRLCTVVALDPSKGRDSKTSDFQATVTLVVGTDGVLYVDADIERRPVDGMVNVFVDTIGETRAEIGVVEDDMLELMSGLCSDQAVKERLLAPIQGISTEGKPKPLRIRRLSPYITRGRVKYRQRSRGTRLLIEQLQDFPNGDHDDGPDALEMAERTARALLAQKREGVVAGQNPL
jgi:predicted phage terminase large subunit-like protein